MKILGKNEINRIRNDIKYLNHDFLSVRQLMLEKKFISAICGPTCTGKSVLAFNLAKIFETDIISIDSMQVYSGLDIGTDKYDSAQTGVRQYMTNIYKPDHKLTVVEFRDTCRNIIENEFFKKDRIPIMAGGSGLYLRAVIDELDFTNENGGHYNTAGDVGNNIRDELSRQAENGSSGLLRLFMRLQEADPVYCSQISPNDKKRIIRALEVYSLTGRPFSSFQNKWHARKSIYNCCMIGLFTQKEILHANIEKRVDGMLQKGLINEVAGLIKKGYKDSNSLNQAVGYKEVLKYLNGDINIDVCRQEIIQNTKRLAKKQMTWFKADPRINWIRIDNYDNNFELIIHVLFIFM